MSDLQIEEHPIQLTRFWIGFAQTEQVALFGEEHDEDRENATHGDLNVDCTFDRLTGDRSFRVKFEVKLGMTIPSPTFKYNTIVYGEFDFDPSSFDTSNIEYWARSNGFYILLPFIRESIFSLTLRIPSGPYIVPMVAIPL